MQIALERKVMSGRPAVTEEEQYAVRQVKMALNRLGFYTPDKNTGMTAEIDEGFKDSLYAFQRKATIFFDDVAVGPGSTTERILNRDLAAQDDNAFYIWRTVGDGKVRGEHAARNGQRFSWNNPPDGENPGEDYNCRCWAELVVAPRHPWIEWVNKKREARASVSAQKRISQDSSDSLGIGVKEQEALNIVKTRLDAFKKQKLKMASILLEHYLGNTGESVTLSSDDFSESIQLKKALEDNRQRFEKSFLNVKTEGSASAFENSIKNLAEGKNVILKDFWDSDISKTDWLGSYAIDDPDFYRALGSVKVRSEGKFFIQKRGV